MVGRRTREAGEERRIKMKHVCIYVTYVQAIIHARAPRTADLEGGTGRGKGEGRGRRKKEKEGGQGGEGLSEVGTEGGRDRGKDRGRDGGRDGGRDEAWLRLHDHVHDLSPSPERLSFIFLQQDSLSSTYSGVCLKS